MYSFSAESHIQIFFLIVIPSFQFTIQQRCIKSSNLTFFSSFLFVVYAEIWFLYIILFLFLNSTRIYSNLLFFCVFIQCLYIVKNQQAPYGSCTEEIIKFSVSERRRYGWRSERGGKNSKSLRKYLNELIKI